MPPPDRDHPRCDGPFQRARTGRISCTRDSSRSQRLEVEPSRRSPERRGLPFHRKNVVGPDGRVELAGRQRSRDVLRVVGPAIEGHDQLEPVPAVELCLGLIPVDGSDRLGSECRAGCPCPSDPADPFSSIGAASRAARDRPGPGRAGRPGGVQGAPVADPRRTARTRSPRTSPRRARSSGRSGARSQPHARLHAGTATSRSSLRDRTGRSAGDGTTSRPLRGTRHNRVRSVGPRGRSRSQQPSLILQRSSVGRLHLPRQACSNPGSPSVDVRQG